MKPLKIKEYPSDDTMIRIKFRTPYSSGEYVLNLSIWINYQNKFKRVMKDCIIEKEETL